MKKVIFLLATLLTIASFSQDAKMNLNYKVKIQFRLSQASDWRNIVDEKIEGLSGVQYYLDNSYEHRMIIEVEKPQGLKGTLRVRTPIRLDGVTLSANSTVGRIIFGPQAGCEGEKRCEPLSTNDVGLVEIRLDSELANATAFGAFLLRPFTVRPEPAIRPVVQYNDKNVPCGTAVKKKGFWIFAKSIFTDASLADTISLCAINPKGKRECAELFDWDLKIKGSKKGLYTFILWNEDFNKTKCDIYLV